MRTSPNWTPCANPSISDPPLNVIRLLNHTAELTRDFRHNNPPADRAAGEFFRTRRYLGSHERQFVGDAFFTLLRHLRRIDRAILIALENYPVDKDVSRATAFPCDHPPNDRVWANPGNAPREWTKFDNWLELVRAALAAEEFRPGTLREASNGLAETWWGAYPVYDAEWMRGTLAKAAQTSRRLRDEPKSAEPAVKHSIADWMWGLMGYGLRVGEMEQLAGALNHPAPVCVRPNLLATTADELQEALEAKGLFERRGEIVTDCLVLKRRARTGDLPGEREGAAEYQDESSQFAATLVAAEPGQVVIDACAGAGGKALQIAALNRNQARILAHEPVERRRKALVERATGAGARIEILERRQDAPMADWVVVDVPCTGSGVIRRSPDRKWRCTRGELERRVQTQRRILAEWSEKVRAGGMLAYMTCSLFADENSAIVDHFLDTHKDFARSPLPDVIRRDMRTREGDAQLLPHRHGTDGFFVSLLRRS